MRGLFDMDGPLMNGLGRITDCILLSLCWITFSLPIVTMGAASGALYRTVYRCLRHDEGNLLKVYWETFRKNLKSGIDGLSKEQRTAMLKFANTAAYIVTTRKGAIRSMPERAEVEALLEKI